MMESPYRTNTGASRSRSRTGMTQRPVRHFLKSIKRRLSPEKKKTITGLAISAPTPVVVSTSFSSFPNRLRESLLRYDAALGWRRDGIPTRNKYRDTLRTIHQLVGDHRRPEPLLDSRQVVATHLKRMSRQYSVAQFTPATGQSSSRRMIEAPLASIAVTTPTSGVGEFNGHPNPLRCHPCRPVVEADSCQCEVPIVPHLQDSQMQQFQQNPAEQSLFQTQLEPSPLSTNSIKKQTQSSFLTPTKPRNVTRTQNEPTTVITPSRLPLPILKTSPGVTTPISSLSDRTVSWDPAFDSIPSATPCDPLSRLNAQELKRYDQRVLAYDRMYMLLHRICHAKDRWVHFVPDYMSERRRVTASAEAKRFWKQLAEDECIPHSDSETTTTNNNNNIIALRIMERMWKCIYVNIFEHTNCRAKAKGRGKDTVWSTAKQDDWEQLAEKMKSLFTPFVLVANAPTREKFVTQLRELCKQACEVRSLMWSENEGGHDDDDDDDGVTYQIYMPVWYDGQEKRYELISGDVRVYRPGVNGDEGAEKEKENGLIGGSAGYKEVCMVLCGGLVRTSGPRGCFRVVERKAVGVLGKAQLGRIGGTKVGREWSMETHSCFCKTG